MRRMRFRPLVHVRRRLQPSLPKTEMYSAARAVQDDHCTQRFRVLWTTCRGLYSRAFMAAAQSLNVFRVLWRRVLTLGGALCQQGGSGLRETRSMVQRSSRVQPA